MAVRTPILQSLGTLAGAFREHVGIAPAAVLVLVAMLGALGAGLAAQFPKYQATALLPTPADAAAETVRKLAPPLPPPFVTLPELKRAMAALASSERLSAFVTARKLDGSAAAGRLLVQSRNPGYWGSAVVPAFPISRSDQREIGDARDQALPPSMLLGVQVNADARQTETALTMADILAVYVADGLMLERFRAWVVVGRRDAETAAGTLRADLLKLQMDIRQAEQRVADTKTILARYPDAKRLEGRQVLGVNPSDGSDRFLSPLAQLVSLEGLISQLRESSRRAERQLHQSEALLAFFAAADAIVQRNVTFDGLLRDMQALLDSSFPGGQAAEEWRVEAGHRIAAAIGYFRQVRTQMELRGEARAEVRSVRSPVAFAALFAMLGLMPIAAVALLRVAARHFGRTRVPA